MSKTLSYLLDAIETDLGDVADIFPSGFLARAVNEGQRRLAPEILQQIAEAVTIPQGATTYDLPADCYDVLDLRLQPDATTRCLPAYQQIGRTLYFETSVRADYPALLFYRAPYPEITDAADCQLPDAASDALVSYGLYKAFRRLAASRSEYRKFATIVGNGTSVGDLEQTADLHLKDFEDAKDAAAQLLPPLAPYGGN